jgi:hypothetical protein
MKRYEQYFFRDKTKRWLKGDIRYREIIDAVSLLNKIYLKLPRIRKLLGVLLSSNKLSILKFYGR